LFKLVKTDARSIILIKSAEQTRQLPISRIESVTRQEIPQLFASNEIVAIRIDKIERIF